MNWTIIPIAQGQWLVLDLSLIVTENADHTLTLAPFTAPITLGPGLSVYARRILRHDPQIVQRPPDWNPSPPMPQ